MEIATCKELFWYTVKPTGSDFKYNIFKHDEIHASDYGNIIYLDEIDILLELTKENVVYAGKVENKPDSAGAILVINPCFFHSRVKIYNNNICRERLFKVKNYENHLIILNYIEYMFINIFEIEVANYNMSKNTKTPSTLPLELFENYNYKDISNDVYTHTSLQCKRQVRAVTTTILEVFTDKKSKKVDFEKLPKFKCIDNLKTSTQDEINTYFLTRDFSDFVFFLKKFFEVVCQDTSNKFFGYKNFINPNLNNTNHRFLNETREEFLIKMCLHDYGYYIKTHHNNDNDNIFEQSQKNFCLESLPKPVHNSDKEYVFDNDDDDGGDDNNTLNYGDDYNDSDVIGDYGDDDDTISVTSFISDGTIMGLSPIEYISDTDTSFISNDTFQDFSNDGFASDYILSATSFITDGTLSD